MFIRMWWRKRRRRFRHWEKGVYKNLKVYGFKKGWQGIMEMDNVQKEGRAFIGGNMEKSQVAEGLAVIYNGEGFIRCLDPRALFWEGEEKEVDMSGIRYMLYGNCFVCRVDGDGNFMPLEDGDVEIIRKRLKAVVSVRDGIITVE